MRDRSPPQRPPRIGPWRLPILCVLLLAGSSCATQAVPRGAGSEGSLSYPGRADSLPARATGLYDWGEYEQSLYARYTGGEPATAEAAVRRVIEVAERAGRSPPPGLQADYGLLRWQAGDRAAAIESFEREAKAYPEAAPLMQKLIARLGAEAPAGPAVGPEGGGPSQGKRR